jgi:hypothetical protein
MPHRRWFDGNNNDNNDEKREREREREREKERKREGDKRKKFFSGLGRERSDLNRVGEH